MCTADQPLALGQTALTDSPISAHAGRILVFFSCALLWLLGPVASAHPVSQGAVEIQITPAEVTLQARVSNEEILVEAAARPAGGGGGSFTGKSHSHADYLLHHIIVLADGAALTGRVAAVVDPSTDESQPLWTRRVVYRLVFPLTAKSLPKEIRVEENLLREIEFAPGNPWEATFVTQIGNTGATPQQGVLLSFKQPITYSCQWPAGAAAGSTVSATETVATTPAPLLDRWRLVRQYIWEGIMHIATGYDHMLFMAALVLGAATFWDLVKVVTAFTLSHSITLALSVLGYCRLPSSIVEPMIAASIVFVAVQNVFWPRSGHGRSRLLVAFGFGLFHGLGFAGGLLDAMAGLAGLATGLAIVAFSLGVELGHQLVVIPLFSAIQIARKVKPEQASLISFRAQRWGSALISCAGVFYLIAALNGAE